MSPRHCRCHRGRCTCFNDADWQTDSYDTYHLTQSSVEDFLTELFGRWDFGVKVSFATIARLTRLTSMQGKIQQMGV
jgi:hypothetical protein